MEESGDMNAMSFQVRLTYSSHGTAGVNTEGEVREAVVAEVWFA